MKLYYIPSKRCLKKLEDKKISEELLNQRFVRTDKAPDGGKVFPLLVAKHNDKTSMISVPEDSGVKEGIESAIELIDRFNL
jgi:hypothetical protein